MYFLLALTLFLAGLVSTVVSWRVARLDTTPKLFTFTFLLVAFGSQTIVGACTSPHVIFMALSLPLWCEARGLSFCMRRYPLSFGELNC